MPSVLTVNTVRHGRDRRRFEEQRFPVPRLWFMPTDEVHSYTLYWRDAAYIGIVGGSRERTR